MLAMFGHVIRLGTLAHTVMHGRVEGRLGRGRPQGNWGKDVRIWVEKLIEVCVRMAVDMEEMEEDNPVPQRPQGYRCDLT